MKFIGGHNSHISVVATSPGLTDVGDVAVHFKLLGYGYHPRWFCVRFVLIGNICRGMSSQLIDTIL
jgi:hypothetical protein